MGRSSRWLVFLPVAFLALLPTQANAEPEPGLHAVGYLINQLPPVRSDDAYPTCGSEIENNINRNFNGEPFQDCGWDYFMVHYTGFINIPEHDTIRFMVAADDGGTVSIAGHEFGTWNLKGCSWSTPITLSVMPGPQPLDGWFFEWWGGACYMLAWNINETGWEIVPEWAYTTTSTPPTTTTTSTVPLETVPVTDPPTTTTLQETSTSTSSTTTTSQPPEPTTSTTSTTTTTEPETTTSSSTVGTSPPATSPTPVWVAPPTTETPAPATTVQEELPQEEPQPPATDPEVPETPTSDDTLPPVPEDPQEPAMDIPVEDDPTIDGEPPVSPVDESKPPVSTIATPETLLEALDASSEPTPAQAAQLATNPEVLAVASVEQATAIFEALNVNELDDTQIAALVAAVQDAPTEIREAFEDTINIFGEGLDDYVPLGSNIPVGTRRTLIAVTAGLALATAGTRIRR